VLANDLRTLLGVPVSEAADSAPEPRQGRLAVADLYCRALGALGRLVRPTPARAQAPAASRPPAPAAGLRGPAPAAPASAPLAGIRLSDTSGARLRMRLQELSARQVSMRQAAARYQIEIHKKFAIASACLVFVLIGAPVALRFPRGGVGLVIGASVLIFGFYYVGLIGGETLADELIVSPFWAMWGANLAMTVIGLVFFLRLNRQRVAARSGGWRERLAALGAWWRGGR
jgi:lipopolysaccharide export system permease protein